jgi:hypothetical protein
MTFQKKKIFFLEANIRLASQEILTFYGIRRLIAVLTRASHWTGPEPRDYNK